MQETYVPQPLVEGSRFIREKAPRDLPKGTGYKAEPRPGKTRANPKVPAMQWAGQIVRWTGLDPEVKRAVKRAERAQHAALPCEPSERPKSAAAAHKSYQDRARQITAHNRKCTVMEQKAKDGKLRKEGILNIISGETYAPFTLKLGRLANTGYIGGELRAIRAEKGIGRPAHV